MLDNICLAVRAAIQPVVQQDYNRSTGPSKSRETVLVNGFDKRGAGFSSSLSSSESSSSCPPLAVN